MELRGTIRTIPVLLLALFAVPHSAHGWERVMDDLSGRADDWGQALDAALSSDGNVVVAGSNRSTVIKLAVATGENTWRYDVGSYAANAVAIGPAGDVVAAGRTGGVGFLSFVSWVAKISGSTGMEVWRHDAIGEGVASNHYSAATDVAVDAAGDVVAVGWIDSFPRVAVVVKLSGADGSESWRYPITDGVFRSVRIDASGDVVASGTVGAAPDASIVVKLAGTDGHELWRRDIADPQITTIDLDLAGNVFAAGYTAAAYGILKLAAGTGNGLWRHDGKAPLPSFPPALAALPTGDVIASDPAATVVRLAGTDGSELWRQALGCTPSDTIDALGIDGAGGVGVLLDACSTSPKSLGFTAARLSVADGSTIWRRDFARAPAEPSYFFFDRRPGLFHANTVVGTQTGDIVAGGFISLHTPRSEGIFAVVSLSGADGALDVCTDGYVDAGEQCDDGNDVGDDCCSNTCVVKADGSPCVDANQCTIQDTCAQGLCVSGPPLPCEPCGTCDPEYGCFSSLPFECRGPMVSRGAVVNIEDSRRRDSIMWTWTNGEATSKEEFGDPLDTTGYALCVFGDSPSPLFRAAAPANPDCARPGGCWRSTPKGFAYRNRAGRPDGLSRITLRAGAVGRAKILVTGKGGNLALPPLPLSSGVTVQLRKLDGSGPCWSAVHRFVRKAQTNKFIALGD